MVTASQSIKLYELLNKHFKNNEDAKAAVESIEHVIDQKFDDASDRIASKFDLLTTKDDLRNDIARLEVRMEQGFKDQLKWTIVLMMGFSSLIIAVIKLT